MSVSCLNRNWIISLKSADIKWHRTEGYLLDYIDLSNNLSTVGIGDHWHSWGLYSGWDWSRDLHKTIEIFFGEGGWVGIMIKENTWLHKELFNDRIYFALWETFLPENFDMSPYSGTLAMPLLVNLVFRGYLSVICRPQWNSFKFWKRC